MIVGYDAGAIPANLPSADGEHAVNLDRSGRLPQWRPRSLPYRRVLAARANRLHDMQRLWSGFYRCAYRSCGGTFARSGDEDTRKPRHRRDRTHRPPLRASELAPCSSIPPMRRKGVTPERLSMYGTCCRPPRTPPPSTATEARPGTSSRPLAGEAETCGEYQARPLSQRSRRAGRFLLPASRCSQV